MENEIDETLRSQAALSILGGNRMASLTEQAGGIARAALLWRLERYAGCKKGPMPCGAELGRCARAVPC